MTFWLACARSLHIASSILLAAAFLFRLIVLRPAAARCGRPEKFSPGLRGAWSRLALASWITVIVSGIAWFGAVTASIAGETSLFNVSPETFLTVLLQTQFGRLWLARSGCCLVLGVLLLIDCRESIIAFFSLAILASLAVTGHAAATASSASMVALLGDMGHLVAAALWPGGLVPLLMVLSWQRRDAERKNLRFVAELVSGFSALSLVVVVFLAATGILNACFIVGSLGAIFNTEYGNLLLFKIALFFVMVGFGACNLLVLKPRLIRLAVAEKQAESSVQKPFELLVRNVICETLLAAGVVLIVGYLGVTPPPMH